MRPADNNIEKQIKNLRTQASAELDEKMRYKFQQAFEKEKIATAKPESTKWGIIMHSRITKLATATTILTAVLVSMKYFGGSINVASPVFADVMERIYKAKNVTYSKTLITPDVNFTSTDTAVEPGLLRSEMPYDTVMLFDFVNGVNMTIYPTQKKCYINRTVGRKRTAMPFSWLSWIQKMHRNPAKYSHSEVLEGKNVDVYLIEVSYEKTTVWVNPQTELPVKISIEQFPNTEVDVAMPGYSLNKKDFGGSENESTSGSISSGRGSGLGISDRTIQIMTDFVWDQKLDPSLFNFEPGEDWQVIEKQHLDSEIEKEDLIKALSFWTEMSGGKFPKRINDLMDPNFLNSMLIEKYNIGGNPDEQFEQARKQAVIVIRGLYFAQQKKAQNNWHYTGDEAVFGDSDTPIAWWQNEEDGTWTVIYADLSIDKTAKEPPSDIW